MTHDRCFFMYETAWKRRGTGTPEASAVAMVQEGQSQARVARGLGVGSGTVTRCWQAYQRKGDDGLAAKRHPGPKPKLSGYQRKLLQKRLMKGAKANGYSTDLWTCPRIAEVTERH